jgi:hypothetical protein
MVKFKMAAAFLVAAFCFGEVSQAQSSMPLYSTSYRVQVKWEMWRNGNSYWATEFESADLQTATMVYDLFEAAFESGQLCEILGCGFDWIPVDIRLKTHYTWNLQTDPVWQPAIRTYR